MNSKVAVGRLDVNLGHKSTLTKLRNHLDDVINSDLLQGIITWIDSLVHTESQWGRHVQNKVLFIGLASLWYDTKTVHMHMQVRQWRGRKRMCYPA